MPLKEFEDKFPRLCALLRRAVSEKRTGQAYLFAGDDAGLLERFSLSWIQSCSCQDSKDGEACGVCRNCRHIEAQTSAELFIVRPQSKRRWIVVDQIRDLEHQLDLTVGKNQLKVGFILEADGMNEQAQNAFLKNLEEPGPRTMLVLTSTRPRKLLPTIRSRCQIVQVLTNRRDYQHIFELGVFDFLKELRPLSGGSVALRCSRKFLQCLGKLRDAAAELASESDDHRWDKMAEVDSTLKKELEESLKNREQAEYLRLRDDVIDAVQTWFAQLLLIVSGVDEELLPHPELLKFAGIKRSDLSEINPDDAERANQLAEELARFLRTNVEEQMVVDAFCQELCAKM